MRPTALHDDLLGALCNAAASPWALLPDRLPAIAGVIADAGAGKDVSPGRLSAAIGSASDRQFSGAVRDKQNGRTLIIPISGLILYGLDFPPFTTGMKKLAERVQDAARDPSVDRIAFTHASPGGTVVGVAEAADAIYRARDLKATISFVDPLAASASFWLAVQAAEVVSIPSGDTASLGVFALHISHAEALKKAGLEASFIVAEISPRKVDANPLEPLTPRARVAEQGDVDAYGQQFLEAVARGRGMDPDVVRLRFGGGRLLSARDAVRARAIDRLAPNLMAALASTEQRRSRSASGSPFPAPAGASDDSLSLGAILQRAIEGRR